MPFFGNGRQHAGRAEVAALKKEVAKLEAERDILRNRSGLPPTYARQECLVLRSKAGRAALESVAHGFMRRQLAFATATAQRSDVLLMEDLIRVDDRNFCRRAPEHRFRYGADRHAASCLIQRGRHHDLLRRGLVFMQNRIVFDGPVEEAEAYQHREAGAADTAPAAKL